MRPLLTYLALATLSFAATAIAQDQPSPTTGSSPAAMAINPAPGSTMESVRSKFGSPSQEVPAVGKPPITRWEYPGYVVFFENDRVLHTVVVK